MWSLKQYSPYVFESVENTCIVRKQEKMLITSIFSFTQNVFKAVVKNRYLDEQLIHIVRE